MQPLSTAKRAISSTACAAAILDIAPGLVWYVRRHIRQHRKGLSVPQFRILFKVQKQGKASLSCVAEHIDASLPTTSRIVANLVDKGFLTRVHDTQDRRQLILTVTARGGAIIDAAREASLGQIAAEFSDVGSQEQGTICEAMEILAGFLARTRKAAPETICPAPKGKPVLRKNSATARPKATTPLT